MQSSTSHPRDASARQDWFNRLTTSGAHYGVDFDQRVTRWSVSAEQLLGPREQALGRLCYEVTAAADPRNAGRCRPNCAVITAARQGQAHPDFQVFLPPCAGVDRARVSVMLVDGDGPGEALVLHVLHSTDEAAYPDDTPGRMRATLQGAAAGIATSIPGCAIDGGPTLTGRQRDVLVRLAAGESPRGIARALGVSAVTVRNHLQGAMERLDAHSRLEAVLTATNAGLL